MELEFKELDRHISVFIKVPLKNRLRNLWVKRLLF